MTRRKTRYKISRVVKRVFDPLTRILEEVKSQPTTSQKTEATSSSLPDTACSTLPDQPSSKSKQTSSDFFGVEPQPTASQTTGGASLSLPNQGHSWLKRKATNSASSTPTSTTFDDRPPRKLSRNLQGWFNRKRKPQTTGSREAEYAQPSLPNPRLLDPAPAPIFGEGTSLDLPSANLPPSDPITPPSTPSKRKALTSALSPLPILAFPTPSPNPIEVVRPTSIALASVSNEETKFSLLSPGPTPSRAIEQAFATPVAPICKKPEWNLFSPSLTLTKNIKSGSEDPELTSIDKYEFDSGSASDRDFSVSSQSTNSVASNSNSTRARASSAREKRDRADARRVLKTIQQVREGTYQVKKGGRRGKYLIERVLHPSGYKLLQKILKEEENKSLQDYVNGDVFRFDYIGRPSAGDKQFVIHHHMPTAFHEGMAGQVNRAITTWLDGIISGETEQKTREVAENIIPTLATRVKCDKPSVDRLEPDLSFRYSECTVADLVIEVAWSQRDVNLQTKAKRFIDGKNGAIRTVVGFDFFDIYKGGRKATFSVWKAKLDGDKWMSTLVDNKAKEFIDEYGQPIKDCQLILSLRDFICEVDWEGRIKEDFEDVPLVITSTTLHKFYKIAFRGHVMGEAEEMIEEVTEKADGTITKISSVNRKVMGKKELAELKKEITGDIDDMKKLLKRAKSEMDKADQKMGMVESKKVGAEKKVTDVETYWEGWLQDF